MLFGPAVPVRRDVLPWSDALLGLADRLENGDPVSACGMVRLLVTLTDGASPLYDPNPSRSVEEAVRWIADGLDVPVGERETFTDWTSRAHPAQRAA